MKVRVSDTIRKFYTAYTGVVETNNPGMVCKNQ